MLSAGDECSGDFLVQGEVARLLYALLFKRGHVLKYVTIVEMDICAPSMTECNSAVVGSESANR